MVPTAYYISYFTQTEQKTRLLNDRDRNIFCRVVLPVLTVKLRDTGSNRKLKNKID
jgi:hypothetical protein